MFDFKGSKTTQIRIRKRTGTTTDEDGIEVPVYEDLIDEDILCEWKNKFGGEVYEAEKINAKEPARIRLWYIPGIDETYRIIRIEDQAEFEIINIDDADNRHLKLEIELKRYVAG